MKYTLDAKDKKLGRLATEIAVLLMGKNSVDFKKEQLAERQIEIINGSKLMLDEKKLETKKYHKFSGYPGGLKEETMENLIKRKGYGEIIKIAVYGMLPKNKLRAKMIRNLIIKE